MTGTTTPSLRKKLVRAFSPPLTPSFVAAFAVLKVSFPGACPGKDVFLFLTKRQRVVASLNPFSLRATLSFSKYVFAKRKRIIIEII